MSRLIYNLSLATGLALIGTGAGILSVPLAMCAVGGLIIVLTLLGAWLEAR